MNLITKEFSFDMGHRVPNHKSQCRNPHGHTYKLQVTLTGDIVEEEGVSDQGMLIDFSDIKEITKNFIDENLDHGFMYYVGDPVMSQLYLNGILKDFKHLMVEFVPTAENISKFIFDSLNPLFKDKYGTGLKLHSVKLWETPTSMAEYIAHTSQEAEEAPLEAEVVVTKEHSEEGVKIIDDVILNDVSFTKKPITRLPDAIGKDVELNSPAPVVHHRATPSPELELVEVSSVPVAPKPDLTVQAISQIDQVVEEIGSLESITNALASAKNSLSLLD